MSEKTAIIIGAGPAGLTAAYELLTSTDIKPVILEATGDIGGISRTHVHNGRRMDLGGHRFFSKSKVVTDFWLRTMPMQGSPARDDIKLKREKTMTSGGPDPEKHDRVMLLRNRVSRILYLRKFFDYPIALKPQTIANLGFARTMKSGFGYMAAMVFKREEKSLEDFMVNRFGLPLYHMFFEDYNRKLWGVSPADMEPDWGAQRIKGLSLTKAVLHMFSKQKETSLIEEFWYPKKGPGQLWETVADDIRRLGGEIVMNAEVVEAQTKDGQISAVTAKTADGEKTYNGDYFFSSMPVKDLVKAMPQTQVPKDVAAVAEKLPYRDFMTVGLLVDKLLIENKTKIKTVNNIVPDCWIYIQERDVKIGRLQIFNNWSPYMLTEEDEKAGRVWIGLEYFCNEGDEMWAAKDADFIAFATSELVKIGIIKDTSVVRERTVLRVKKAYPAYFGVYKQFPKVREYLDGFENLFCIGRNGQHRYNNMDHSMLTAMTAVELIKSGSKNKVELWNVNAEQEYHETKKP